MAPHCLDYDHYAASVPAARTLGGDRGAIWEHFVEEGQRTYGFEPRCAPSWGLPWPRTVHASEVAVFSATLIGSGRQGVATSQALATSYLQLAE